MIKLFVILFLSFVAVNHVYATPQFLQSEQSYAEEYRDLRKLLERVKDTESALLHRNAIEKEILRLRQIQPSGGQYFKSLSNDDKKQFIKRFQMNRFHCGEVTQVMEERRRILFDPKLYEILADTLAQIP